ncbi:MAG: hypothetical protein ACKV0T_01460 [Planctomycetales bacterium]
MDDSFSGIGLPTKSRVTLAYHEPTRTVIVHVESPFELPPRRRLFFRWATDTHYQPVATFPENISIDSFVVDTPRPALYFITFTWKARPGRKTASGNWDALYRFDLNKHRSERLTGRGDLRPPDGVDETWLNAILSVSNDGHSIFCNAALLTQRCAEYWICELDLGNMRLRPVTRLDAVFA